MNMMIAPRTNEQRPNRLTRGNTVMPCLAISNSLTPKRGSSRETSEIQNNGMTVAIDANGGGSSQFRLTLVQLRNDSSGNATTSVTYRFDGASGGSGTVTAVCPTLHELIRQLNLIAGVNAWALHAPHYMPLAADTFQDLSATKLGNRGNHSSILYRTVASGTPGYLRIGNPEELDNGHIRFMSLRGTCTGVTAGTMRIFRDAFTDNIASGSEVVLLQKTLVGAETAYVDKDKSDALDYRGPIIVEVNSSNLTAFDYTTGHMQGDV